jgi:hypothetical protein
MATFANFVKDFPGRCEEILYKYGPSAITLGREVTLMLVVAAAGINIPHERLKKSDHPSRDRDRFAEADRQFKDLRKSRFLGRHYGNKRLARGGMEGSPMIREQQISGSL